MRYFLALVVLLLTSTSVLSQLGQLCNKRPVVIEYLLKRFSEKPVIIMVDNIGRLVEVLVNTKTGSWSLLVTLPGDNMGCVLRFGTGIQFFQNEEPGRAIQHEEPERNQQEEPKQKFLPYRSKR